MQRLQKGNGHKNGETGTKPRIHLVKATCWTLISVGAVSLMISIISDSQTPAFIGLGLLFWGALLLYIQPEEYTKKVLLDAATLPSLETLSQIIDELGYKGKAIYLPPKYLKDPEANKAYLPKRRKEQLPEPEVILNQENHLFIKNPKGILLTPPGSELTKLFEKRLGISFTQTDLQYIKRNLPKLFMDHLEIAENLEIQIKSSKSSTGKTGTNYGTIHVKITNSIFRDTYKENTKLSQVYNTIGSPICSAIACALTKVTGKPLIIEVIQSSEDGKIIEVTYKVEKLEYNEQAEAPLAEVIELLVGPALLSKLPSLILIALGSLTLIWIGHFIWYEMAVWNKSLDLVLFTSRAGEPIDLGRGMKVIYYFAIGLALLFSGILTYLKRSREVIEYLVSPRLLSKLPSLFLIVLGSLTLIWIGHFIWYDMTEWSKDIGNIFFGSRTSEPISLGIGMKVIYYFVIGLALLFSGILTYLRKKRGKA